MLSKREKINFNMPAKPKKQLKLIYAKRNQFKSEENTPKKWKWVWSEEWGHLKENIKKFKDFNESINHPLYRQEYDEFYEIVSDYMLEWSDRNVDYEFIKSTFEYETKEDLSDPSIMRLRIFHKNINIDTENGHKVLKTEKTMEISNLINECCRYIMHRISKTYNILYISSSHWDPFNHSGGGDKRWIPDRFYGNYDCLIRFIKFKLTSKK